MPETNEGILFLVGAIFFFIGLIGGGLEVSAIKIPPINKIPRYLIFIMGTLLMGIALVRFLVPTAAASPTPTAEFTPIPPTETSPPPTATSEPPTATPPGLTPTDTLPEKSGTSPQVSSGRINDIWVDYDVVQLGRDGMLIHVKFQVDGLLNIPCVIGAYFYTESGEQLMDVNGAYVSEGGQVLSYQEFTPVYPSAVFNDFELFMPYDELDLPDGDYELKFSVSIWDMASVTQVISSPYFSFSYSQN